jgi:hypothetical protein
VLDLFVAVGEHEAREPSKPRAVSAHEATALCDLGLQARQAGVQKRRPYLVETVVIAEADHVVRQ